MHQNHASPFASDFYRRQGYRKEFRTEDHFYLLSTQKNPRFASDLLRRGICSSWGLKKSRDFSGSGKNRRRNRRESRDFWGRKRKENNKQKSSKHMNIFLTALADSPPREEPPPVPGTNGTKWRFYCGIRQKTAGLSQGRVPICPREGSRLSQGWFLFVPDTVPPKMFMFIGFFFCPRFWCTQDWNFQARLNISSEIVFSCEGHQTH